MDGLFDMLKSRTGKDAAGAHHREHDSSQDADHQYLLAENFQRQAPLFDKHFRDTSATKRQEQNLPGETRFDEVLFRKVAELFVLKD